MTPTTASSSAAKPWRRDDPRPWRQRGVGPPPSTRAGRRHHVFAPPAPTKVAQLVLANRRAPVFDHRAAGYLEKILAATGGRGVDLISKWPPTPTLAKTAVLAKQGRVIVIGSRGPTEIDARNYMSRDGRHPRHDDHERHRRPIRARMRPSSSGWRRTSARSSAKNSP